MNHQKQVSWTLPVSVAGYGLYVLILVAMTVFYQPVMAIAGATPEVLEVGRPVPTLTLAGNFAVLAVLFCLYRWITHRLELGDRPLLPCVLAFVFVGLTPQLSLLGIAEQMAVARMGGYMKLAAHSVMTGAYQVVRPLQAASTVLFAIGAALALYRHTREARGNTQSPAALLLLLAAACQGVHLLGAVAITASQKSVIQLWMGAPFVEDARFQIPFLSLGGSAASFGIALLLAWGIPVMVRRGQSPVLPCVGAFVYIGMAPFIAWVGNIVQMRQSNPWGAVNVAAFSALLSAISLLDPLRFASQILLGIGCALAFDERQWVEGAGLGLD